MTDTIILKNGDELTIEQFKHMCKEEGRKINPEIAYVMWQYRLELDPYNVWENMPDEYQTVVGKFQFARNPGSDFWVAFYDLPEKTCKRLLERFESESSVFINTFEEILS